MAMIVDSLFSVLVTLSVVPIIRCSPGHAAEAIARQLDQRLRDHLKDRHHNLFQQFSAASGSFERPVLILLDRDLDCSTILHHTWTYQALVHDLFGLDLNRVTIKPANPREPEKVYNLDKVGACVCPLGEGQTCLSSLHPSLWHSVFRVIVFGPVAGGNPFPLPLSKLSWS